MTRRRFSLLLVFSLLVAVLPLATAAPAGAAGDSDLILTGAYDGPLTGGTPKGVELYVVNDIADLSIYGIGLANNGGGTDGQEFTFPPVSATAGDFIYVATETVEFNNFFGFEPDYTDSDMATNGDDAIELFKDGAVVDIFGDINTDGTDEAWDHVDGWAYRMGSTGPDGSTFDVNNWHFSGTDAFDGETTNATAATPFPTASYDMAHLLITGAIDGPLPGGKPKAIEFYAVTDIADLSVYGVGAANNGGGTDGIEYTFPADTASAGDFIYVAYTSSGVDEFNNFFGFEPDYTESTASNINGDDAIELFKVDGAVVIDVFGDINTDGTDEAWDHLDGWAYRKNLTGPDGPTFQVDSWTYSGPNALDGETTNASAATPFPIGTYVFDGDGGEEMPDVFINEVDAHTLPDYVEGDVGIEADVLPDSAEFIELFDGGVGTTPLDGLVVVLYDGSAGEFSYNDAIDLDGWSTDANGYFLICFDGTTLLDCDLSREPTGSAWLRDGGGGAFAVALYADDASSFPNLTPVTTTNLIDAIVYDTGGDDSPGLLVLLNDGEPQVNEDANDNSILESNQRCPDGTGGLRNTSTYQQHAPTPGAENVCPVPEVITKIHEVQGSGAASSMVGSEVTIEGVVVGDFQDTGLNGFWLQEEDADIDADPLTSEGILVYNTGDAVAIGDIVKVTGTVKEFANTTEISPTTSVTITGTGASALATPVPLVFPVPIGFDIEAIEGMSVVIAQPMTITEYYNYDRYGQIVIAADFPMQPTAVHEPGSPEATALAELNALSRITLDDGETSENPEVSRHPNGGVFDLTNLFRGGDTVANVTGVIDQYWSSYQIQPTAGATYVAANPRPVDPDNVRGKVLKGDPETGLVVATFNVLNYFTTLDGSGPICGPLADQYCRGADDSGEFTRQRDKIIAAIAELDADVVGLMEIENNADASLIDLVAGLNARVGAGTYAYVDAGFVGPDVIKVGIIYQPGTVTPLGAHAILDTDAFLDPNNLGDAKNRAALAQSFTDVATGEAFTVAVNHLKSKGSDCGGGDDEDDLNGGNCNLTRTLAAAELVDWLDGDPTGSGDPDILVIGDLNAYDKEDPIDAIRLGPDDSKSTDDDYRDLLFEFAGENAYSYVYSGQWGYLDYAMANESLYPVVTGAAVWHINSPEPDILDYDTSWKSAGQILLYEDNAYRSSDHDPVLVGLNLALVDDDGDGVPNYIDNCPDKKNTKQRDRDHDGIGNPCDDDLDGDGIPNSADNCPARRNTNQADRDGDGMGNRCDPDDDNDGVPDKDDQYPFNPKKWGGDADNDGIWDDQDNCPLVKNSSQKDADGDGMGNRCDDDNDNDGYLNGDDAYPFNAKRH